jgi:hypothetical protein
MKLYPRKETKFLVDGVETIIVKSPNRYKDINYPPKVTFITNNVEKSFKIYDYLKNEGFIQD